MTEDSRPVANIAFEGRKYTLQGWSEQDLIFRGLVMTGDFYEDYTLKMIRALNIEGVYLDIGANIGNHAVFFAQECKSAAVILFEAVGELCEIAKANMMANALRCPWQVIETAVSNSAEPTLPLWISSPENMGRSKVKEGSSVRVANIRLDDFFKLNPADKIGFIKIDVEGYEAEAIRGGMETISLHRPVIGAECFGGYGKTAEEEYWEIFHLLNPLGYVHPLPSFQGDIPFYLWIPER